MGTRGAVIVRDGDDKELIAYNQFDSYPSGLGQDMLDFTRTLTQIEQAYRNLRNHLRDVIESGSEAAEEWFWHCTGFDQLRPSDTSWLRDSLFCEWAYAIDFDHNKFEVYRGFQTEPHTEGKYSGLPPTNEEVHPYYPVKLIASYDFDKLPADLSELEKNEDE